MDASLSYSSVVPWPGTSNYCNEIVLDVGAPQIALQQFKFGEHCGYFTYKDSEDLSSPCSNRWIYWKCCNENVEFVEQSLDRNLIQNRLLIKFSNTPVLDKVNVFESGNQIVILIATVSSVHRIVLKHPRRLERSMSTAAKQNRLLDTTLPSIFIEINQDNYKDYIFDYVLSEYYSTASNTGIQYPVAVCASLTADNDSLFVLASSVSGIYVVNVSSQSSGNHVTTFEFKQVTIIERFLRGFVPSVCRTGSEGDTNVVSMHIFSLPQDRVLLTLSKDLKVRLWSINRRECISTINILEYFDNLISAIADSNSTPTPSKQLQQSQSRILLQRPYIRKCLLPDTSEAELMSILVKSGNKQKFVVIRFHKPTMAFKCIAILDATGGDLIDFFITPTSIWSLCLNSEGNTDIFYTSLTSISHDWQQIVSSELIFSSVNFKSTFLNVRELFINEIFKSGKFTTSNVVKAIGIFDRSSEITSLDQNSLIEHIINCIELKIRENLDTGELSSTDYMKIEHQYWEKFHVYCLQYENVSSKPLGFLYDQRNGFFGLIRKDDFLFIRSNDPLDDLLLNDSADIVSLLDEQVEERALEQSLRKVIEATRMIQSVLVEDALINFELALFTGDSIKKQAEEIVVSYLLESVDPETNIPLKDFFSNLIAETPQLIEVFKLLFNNLNLDNDDYERNSLNGLVTASSNPSLNSLLSSELGISLLCRCLHQFARLRLNFCRNLILLQKLILHLQSSQEFVDEHLLEGQVIPMTIYYAQLYYVLVWTCETCVQVDQSQILADDNRINMLNLLKLNKHFKPLTQFQQNDRNRSQPLISLFLQNRGLQLSKSLLVDKLDQGMFGLKNVCGNLLNVFTNSIATALWPLNSLNLAEFLLSTGLYEQLIDFTYLMTNLKHKNVHTLQFLKGIGHFQMGEFKSSLAIFLSLFEDIWKEPFIYNVLGIPSDVELDQESLTSEQVYMFFRKLMQFFDENSPLECKVQLCQEALTALRAYTDSESERFVASFLSTFFMDQLELENYAEAYDAIILNTSKEQRKSCLREFILHLYERHLIDQLISYSNSELEDDFVSIIESKARSSDVSLNVKTDSISFYEVLYKYFALKDNYRRAAICMYEFYLRLAQEVPGKESLERQERSIGLALNCLHLIDHQYAWIIKPALKQLPSVAHLQKMANANDSFENSFSFRSNNVSKRDAEGESIQTLNDNQNGLQQAICTKIEVLTINDIKIEYELCRARLRILEKDTVGNKIASSYLNVNEIITMLCENSMYDSAFYLAEKCSLPFEPIFDALVRKYIYYVQNPTAIEEDIKSIQDWFIENETASLSYINYSKASLVQKMWLLISEYIRKFEESNQSFVHKCVAEKLLSSGIDLPAPLRLSYQKRNTAELLLLLMSYNYIEAALNLTLELINGYLGIGNEYFDVTQVVPNAIVYFPRKHVRCLLKILETEKDDQPEYEHFEKQLLKKMDVFDKVMTDVSQLC